MHIHILGVCGTFMGSLAVLAKQLGHQVTGSDANVYPPMSTQLEAQGITLIEGYDPKHLSPEPDLVLIGNAMSRGNPAVEYVLAQGLAYMSGPQWLATFVLQDRWVLGVAGTHGKTTTTSMLTWVLEHAGLSPGYLIGGVPKNFEVSARLGDKPFFVVEADEYDSAFFDKRSKFVHYRPRTLILNNLEFDHADIFTDLAAIQTQFHHLLRTVPNNGLLIAPDSDSHLLQVMDLGCWTPKAFFGGKGKPSLMPQEWVAEPLKADCSEFKVLHKGKAVGGSVQWGMKGFHNMMNGLATIMAARHAGVPAELAVEALCQFGGVKRRLEVLGTVSGVTVYDDFAHHPTAIATTLEGVRASMLDEDTGRLIAVIEPRSNTMRMGCHRDALTTCTSSADKVYWYQPEGMDWSLDSVVEQSSVPANLVNSIDGLITQIVSDRNPGDQVVIMSNGGFGGVHQKLMNALA